MAVGYIRWDQQGVEHGAGPKEDAIIHEIEKQINEAQQRVVDSHHHAFSGTHVKTHGIVKGNMEILPNLPPHLAQSMFAKPGKHPVAIRFSSEPTDLTPDTVPQPRGLGMKVFNVEGTKLRPDGKDPKTQDFEFNSAAALELANAETCRDIIGLRLKHADPQALTNALKQRPDFEAQDARNHVPLQHVFCQRQYSQSAFRYGDYVAKFLLVPSKGSEQEAFTDRRLGEQDSETVALRQGLKDFIEQKEAKFDFCVQLLQNLDKQPIEDTRVAWDANEFPFEKVATVTVPPQDPFTPKRVNFWRDEIRVDPWHGLETLKPLGSINRVRKGVYKASASFRRRMNGGIKEVTVESIDQIPDE
ncbi:heme-dependent catalase [Acaromyces ingoldii]|uniref:Heme-dependent catalase n=1 Tax=Acaromyces ingoldii TaxID=215250 RepID=A0A316YRB4_9BASI|nr:heme-dependent catalase [Acaromyces ingoldii]PWN91917.1 heme-dependent catalase [Acaromyces ingoldii]